MLFTPPLTQTLVVGIRRTKALQGLKEPAITSAPTILKSDSPLMMNYALAEPSAFKFRPLSVRSCWAGDYHISNPHQDLESYFITSSADLTTSLKQRGFCDREKQD